MARITVCARFRPLSLKERRDHGDFVCVKSIDDEAFTLKDEKEGEFKFCFDKVFYENSGQDDVYSFLAQPIVRDVMSATNGAIITYGQTGAGKTHSMEGPNILDCDDSKRGLLARVVDGMFEQINSGDEVKCTIKLSMVEIYMEKVRDLFDLSKDNIQIKETKSQGILLPEVTEIILSDSSKALQSLSSGICNRAVGETRETEMNVSSSRSHCIYIFSVHQEFNKQNREKIGKLVLVDLAGSEKVEKTGAEGKVLEEAKTINKSLSALGNVVYALTCNSNGKANHIPYRNSKLTRILQDSLGGNSQMALLCCCSPSPSNASETLSTLRFGARAKHIKASPRVHYTEDKHAKMLGTSSTSDDESSDQIIDKTSDDEEAKLLEELSTWWGREFDPDGFDDLEFNLVEIAAPAVPLQQAVEELASAVELLKRANEIFEFKLAYAARIFSAHNEGAEVSLTHWILEFFASFSVWFASFPLVMLLAYWFRQ